MNHKRPASLIKTAKKFVKPAVQGKSFIQNTSSAGFKTFMPRSGFKLKVNSIGMRSFSSLPDHIKLEMPNLSPKT